MADAGRGVSLATLGMAMRPYCLGQCQPDIVKVYIN
jgi:hypothetical protein